MSFLKDLELNFAECIQDGGKATLGVRQRVEMDATHRMKQNETISQAVCALLNSGGGVVRVEIENGDYNFERDGVGLNLPPLFRNHLDEMLHGKLFLIYVSSWDVAASHVRLATLCSNLYHRCGTLTEVMDPEEALEFLRRVQDPRIPGDSDSLNLQEAPVGDDQMILASALFHSPQLQYLEKLNFKESSHVEFQMFSADLSQGIRERLPKCVSALANSEGGYVFFGVHDKERQVIGCEKEKINCTNLKSTIDACIRKMPVYHFCGQNYKVQYDLKFLEVYDKEALHGYVCAIKVERFCCAAFAKAPDSWEIKDNNKKPLTANDWAFRMIETNPDLSSFPQMIPRKSMLNTTPCSKTVFTHKYLKCVEDLQKDYFPVSPNRITYTPESVYKDLFSDYKGLRNLINVEMRCFSQGILIFSHSWAVDLGLQRRQDVICDALLISPNNVPILYTICNKWDLGNRHYSMTVARTLKQKLVNVGGYPGRLGIIPLVLPLGSHQRVRNDLEMPVYPESYNFITTQQVEALLQSLVIILFGFRPLLKEELNFESDTVALLSDQQYGLLSTNLSKHREMFVHGLPGSGKTTLALMIVGKIRNVFNCQADDILYICENQSLKRFIVRKNICQAVTRKTFMKNTFNNVQHIIVDEAQNFRTEEGNWFAKAKAITQRVRDGPGVLYIFLDYFQTSHLCCSGLPELQHQKPLLKLTRMLCSGDKITSYLQDIMHQIRANPPPNVPQEALMVGEPLEWGPDVTGNLEIIDNLNLEQMSVYVAEKCQCLWRSGYYLKDVAVLFTRARDIEKCRDKLLLAMRRRSMSQLAEEPSLLVQVREGLDSLGSHVVLESVHRFSGMERSIVFGIIPMGFETAISYNALLSLASRARTHLYILKVVF
ncbi:schlafen family member 5 [Mus caroli]|uniref:Schlafen family member 5 n=1 Tax=Mus caroli TaxID=10089 RepID=A0A6P7REM9_MUSCR|nr:schlafen family member 5 [Mus caroli]XP_021032562.1 schlafen family member 5 [Mus caroli]XP_029339165.1 schlafen family member 5 [Mus caroli]XP_029339166.1 schlafen family member 5 [Mus caroli]XP_029339167.1 schlafen family member 5 [Mus caroli]